MLTSHRSRCLRSRSGFTLISAVISGAVGMLVIFGLLKGLSATYRAERGVASNQDFTAWYAVKDRTPVLRSSLVQSQYCAWPSVSDQCFCPAQHLMTGVNYDQCPAIYRSAHPTSPVADYYFASQCLCCPI